MKVYIYLILIFVWFQSTGQQSKTNFRNEFTVVSYNVENLFDTINDPKIPDEEFLPNSEKQWTKTRYQKKLNDLARVISEINPSDMPEIIGLVEVENREVLLDLIHTGKLRNKQYAIVHEESPDYRGIDVALLYRSDKFNEVMHETLPVVFPDDPDYKTRDILYVVGQMNDKIFHIFVNHWPSRIGGDEKTEPKRVRAATVLKQRIDKLRNIEPDANIIVMGDMNDEPDNRSLKEILGAQSPDSEASLLNLMIPDDLAKLGTYYYNGSWNMLDNLLVSKSMIDQKTTKTDFLKGNIFHNEWMIYINKTGDQTPNRTYVGNKYTGGVSDHFPVYFKIRMK